MSDTPDELEAYIVESLKDPEFKSAWDDAHARQALLDFLVRARRDAGLTQTEVARRMGVSQSTISRLGREDSDPSVWTLQRYARAIGLRVHLEIRAGD